MVARPICWGLAVGGEDGVSDVLSILRAEFENAMALAGTKTVGAIDASFVTHR